LEIGGEFLEPGTWAMEPEFRASKIKNQQIIYLPRMAAETNPPV
jgi:hypothetical protein